MKSIRNANNLFIFMWVNYLYVCKLLSRQKNECNCCLIQMGFRLIISKILLYKMVMKWQITFVKLAGIGNKKKHTHTTYSFFE